MPLQCVSSKTTPTKPQQSHNNYNATESTPQHTTTKENNRTGICLLVFYTSDTLSPTVHRLRDTILGPYCALYTARIWILLAYQVRRKRKQIVELRGIAFFVDLALVVRLAWSMLSSASRIARLAAS